MRMDEEDMQHFSMLSEKMAENIIQKKDLVLEN